MLDDSYVNGSWLRASHILEARSIYILTDDENGLGVFEALEFLPSGIHPKGALWSALGAIAPADPRLAESILDPYQSAPRRGKPRWNTGV